MTSRTVQIAIVVATDLDGYIGRDNALPWHLPADLARFKSITMGKPMIMGRRTWESIGRPLPGRRSIVLTRTRDFVAEGAEVARTPEEALRLAAGGVASAEDSGRAGEFGRGGAPGAGAGAGANPEVMVIGGAAVFRAFLPQAERIHWTQVLAHVGGDVRFPDLDLGEWEEIERRDIPADERNAFATCYRLLTRRV